MLDAQTIMLRLLVAAALGAVIGYERDRHKRSAGLRTHLLVALASAVFMLVSTQFPYHQPTSTRSIIEVDVSRIASNVVSGAGFLAGGVILRSGLSVQGMTTAAALWLVASIGMAAASGMFAVSILVTGLGLVALWVLRSVERKGKFRVRGKVTLEIAGEARVAELLAIIESTGVIVTNYSYRQQRVPARSVAADFSIRHAETFNADGMVQRLEHHPGVRSVCVERRAPE